eukprot:6458702-Prymnesium_polylepis.1
MHRPVTWPSYGPSERTGVEGTGCARYEHEQHRQSHEGGLCECKAACLMPKTYHTCSRNTHGRDMDMGTTYSHF